MKSLDEIKEIIENKNVALVGNSKKVLGERFDVDQHDVVIRMNEAWNLPSEMKESVGNRLDILCISGHKKEIELIAKNVPNVVWMSPKNRDVIPETVKSEIFFYPTDWWQELYRIIGERPSTGCMAVDMLKRLIGTGQLTLYGFDFFKNPSWHKSYSLTERLKLLLGMKIYVNPHDGEKEEQFIKACLPEEQLKIVGLSNV